MRCACAIPLETVTSLSDRFGLEITFSVPDKDEYLYIVEQLAKENDLNLDIDEAAPACRALRAAPQRTFCRVPQDSLSASSWRSSMASN